MKLEDIKGIGKSRIRKLNEAGINEPLDLLLHFPYKYIDLFSPVDLDKLNDGDELSVCGTIENTPTVQYLKKGLNMIKAVLDTSYGKIEAAWFNQKFLVRALIRGKTVYVTGKVKKFRNKISLSAPVIIKPSDEKILPMYRNIRGIPQNVFREAVDMLLACVEINGYIPERIRAKHGLSKLTDAFKEIHHPSDIQSALSAARTLAVEKLSYTISMFDIVKVSRHKTRQFEYHNGDAELKAFIESLPFRLTQSQYSALCDIIKSLKSDNSMNRLLQGDVGCGKTIVALAAMYFAHLNGYQSVLMTPTEILAVQHYKSAIQYLEHTGVKIALLCGSLTKSERDTVLFNIRTKAADIVIGTHALIGDDVTFNNLSLVITDEQQRFGVNQRSNLENKAVGADVLVMTATPIPRTLALCMYGELEQSSITALPSGRPETVTSLVPQSKFGGMFEYVAAKAAEGEQTYIVCPRIDGDDEENLAAATDVYDMLSAKFPDVTVGLLHGRMKDAEKSEVMNRFACGKIGLLVATTVVEVGIDVPSATNIIIFNAERYGLSQLHQLRGRVGRGNTKSFCFLPYVGDADERLKFFCGCRDGFALSEYDFDRRGAGDFIGTRQHGDCDDLPVKIDADLIAAAKSVACDMLSDAESVSKLRDGMTSGTEQYVRSITMN